MCCSLCCSCICFPSLGGFTCSFTLSPQVALCLFCRTLHRLEHALRLFRGQPRIEDGQVDFLFLGKVHLDQRIETIEHTAQGLCLGLATSCLREVRPE